MSVFRKLPPIVPVVEIKGDTVAEMTLNMVKSLMSGTGHQLNSESRALRSAKNCLEQAYRDLNGVMNTTEILETKWQINSLINKLTELACSAEERYNQNI